MRCTFAIDLTHQMQSLDIETKLKLAALEAEFDKKRLDLDVQKMKAMSELMNTLEEHRQTCKECSSSPTA